MGKKRFEPTNEIEELDENDEEELSSNDDDSTSDLSDDREAVFGLGLEKLEKESENGDLSYEEEEKEKGDDDEDEDFDENDEDDSSEAEIAEKNKRKVESVTKKWGTKKEDFFKMDELSEDDDESDESSDADSFVEKNRGKKRKESKGKSKSKDAEKLKVSKEKREREARLEEEEEALRLQQKQNANLTAEDYKIDLDSESDSSDSDDDYEAKDNVNGAGKYTDVVLKPKKLKSKENDDADFEQNQDTFEGLNDDEKLEIMKNKCPEVVQYVEDFNEAATQLNNHILPLLKKLQDANTSENLSESSEKKISYLEAKYQVMLTYCVNLVFYLLLKADGKSIKKHPIIKQLLMFKTLLEKIRPLDAKLHIQIKKLLEKTNSKRESNDNTSSTEKVNLTNPKPELDDFGSEDSASEDSEDEDFKHKIDDVNAKNGDKSKNESDKYVVPKFAAVTYEEKEGALERKKRQDEKQKKKLRKSKLLQDIREEFSERPTQLTGDAGELDGGGFVGGFDKELSDIERERLEYEEDNFVRVRETKKDKLKKLKAMKNGSSKSAKNPFGDLANVTDDFNFDEIEKYTAEKSGTNGVESMEAEREESLMKFMQKMESKNQSALHSKKRKLHTSDSSQNQKTGDEDFDIKDPMEIKLSKSKLKKLKQNNLALEDSLVHFQAVENGSKVDQEVAHYNSDEEDDFYKQAKELSKSKKTRRNEIHEATKYKEREQPNPTVHLSDAEGRRLAGYKILANKGLKPHKKKEDRNPRLRMRNKYEKKLKARKGQIRDMRNKSEGEAYGGEKSGLRTNLVTSRKIGKQ